MYAPRAAGLTELVLERVDFAWPATVGMPKLKKLKISECFATGARLSVFGPGSFPSLEVLAIIDSGKFACPALVATPSLRALIISANLPFDPPGKPALSSRSILYDISTSSLSPRSEWRRGGQRPLHLRCATPSYFGILTNMFVRRDPAIEGLQSLYIGATGNQDDDGDDDPQNPAQLRKAARAQGIRVVDEEEPDCGGFGFIGFLEQSSVT
jgi:hypothetical protein